MFLEFFILEIDDVVWEVIMFLELFIVEIDDVVCEATHSVILLLCYHFLTSYTCNLIQFCWILFELKVMMNTMNVPSKRSTLEMKLDKLILTLFGTLFAMCLIGAIGRFDKFLCKLRIYRLLIRISLIWMSYLYVGISHFIMIFSW